MSIDVQELHEWHDEIDLRLGRSVEHDSRSLAFAAGVLPKSALVAVSWLRRIPIMNQGALGACHDAETEILTESGWVPFPEIDGTERLATVDPDSGRLIYELPMRIVAFPYNGDMHCAAGSSKNFKVTPNHKMLVRPWDESARTLSDSYQLTDVKDVGWYAGMMCSVDHRGDADASSTYTIPAVPHRTVAAQRKDLVVPMDAWLRFLGFYLADGTVTSSKKSPYGIQLATGIKDGRKPEFVREIMTSLGIHFLELKDRVTFNHKQIVTELTRLGLAGVKAPAKFVPRFVFNLPSEQIESLLFGHFMGDGYEQNGLISHTTSSKQLADDLHELVILSGKWGTVSSRQPRTHTMKDGRVIQGRYPEYRVSCYVKDGLSIERKNDISIEQYDGMVYCAEVPTYHTLVTRRQGKVLISGNCTGFAGTGWLGTDRKGVTGGGTVAITTTAAASSQGIFNAGVHMLNDAFGVKLYSLATRLDSINGTYPPTDTGSSGIGIAKALVALGLSTTYQHAFSMDALNSALQSGPVLIGVPWYNSCYRPDSSGLIPVDKGSGLAGGHELELVAWDGTDRYKVANSWGDRWGVSGYGYFNTAGLTSLLGERGDVTVPNLATVPPVPPLPAPVPTSDDATLWAAAKTWAAKKGLK
jgi:hypothetical protein